MIYLIWFVVFVAALALYFRQVYSRFSKYGVKTTSCVPPFGDMFRVLFRLDHFGDSLDKSYYAYPEEKFIGRYEFMTPMLVIRDLDLIKRITVKDFEYFLDHRTLVDEKTDPFFGRNLFSLKGQEWKDMRSTLSPAFTSSKMKLMLPFMVEVGNQMVGSLKTKLKDSKTGYLDIDCKDMTTRYANDVIASCAFGLKVDSLVEEDNDFYKMGKKTSNFSFKQFMLIFVMVNFPILTKVFNFKLFEEDTKRFFKHLVLSTMGDREARRIIRPDMIHLLMEAKKGRLMHEDKTSNDSDAGFATVEESNVGKKNVDRDWTDDDLIAQAILFFIAGFETVSTGMSFALHELAINPDVQDKLVEEIRANDKKNNGKFDYNSIQNMPYMDMVISEVLRMWPPAIAMDRVCIKDYNLGKPSDNATQDYIIRKGEGVGIPTWSFHRDPKFFPNPEKFEPERFSEENRSSIHPFAYMPFGLGPRNCIGSRFALCEVKVMLYQLLLNMVVEPSSKTKLPAKLSKETFNARLEGGHWIRLKLRE